MAIILDQYPLLEKGTFEIRQMVTLLVSAEEARRKVDRWLRRDVSHMLGADAPTLVVSTRMVWRVPIHFSAPQAGVVGQVGTVEVDTVTGKMYDLASCQVSIEQRAKALAATLPPYRSQTKVPVNCIPQATARAPMVTLNDDDEPVLSAAAST